MKRSQGFTVIEIIAVALFLGIASIILFIQRDNLLATERDNQRKVAVNAMYYNLEEVFFAQNGFYPSEINSETLRAMDPALFTDPNGIKMNEPDSNYHYTATNCDNTKCKSYTLGAELEKEATFTKKNR